MKTKAFLLSIFMLLLSSAFLTAQPGSLTGRLVSLDENKPLVGAHVIIESEKSWQQKASISGENGVFNLYRIPEGAYSLTISFVGYHSYKRQISIGPGINNLGLILLEKKAQNLDEVKVEKKIPLANVKEDTLEYNSDAYKTTPDASAEDLVAKMPGVEVTEGSVKAQGEEVQKLLVDGRPFFNNDPSLALRNLPAEIIEKIQLYEEQSEQSQFTGFDDGNRIRTMNIITRRNMRNGQFGKFYAAAGPEEKYALSGSYNSFNGDRRITLIGQSNNVNQQDFSAQDLLGSMNRRRGGGAGMGGMGRPGGGGSLAGSRGSDFMIGKKNGVSTINSFGLNYTDSWSEELEISLNYFYNHLNNSIHQDIFRQYLLENLNGQEYSELDEVNSKNSNHRIFGRIDYQPNERNRIMFRPNISIQGNEYNSMLLGETFKKGELISKTSSDFISSASAIKGSTDLILMHRFDKTGRSVSLALNSNFSNREGENYLLALNEFYRDQGIQMDSTDQFSETSQPSNSLGARLAYTEPVSENSLIQFSYRYSINWNNSDRKTWNFDPESIAYSDIDSIISGIFKNKYNRNQAGIGYRYRKDKLMFMAGINYENTQLDNDQKFPNPGISQYSFNSILPNAMLNLRGESGKNLRIMYRSFTDIPSISQLQEVVDNTNNLQLSTGNSGLKQELSHNLIFRYSTANIDKASLFYAGARISLDQDHISNTLYIPENDTIINGITVGKGTQLTVPENFDGYYRGSLFLTYGIPLQFIHCNLNLNGSLSQSRNPGRINDETGYSIDRAIAIGVALVSNISDRLDFTLSSNTSYSVPVSSFNEALSENYLFQLSRLKVRWIMPLGFVFDARLTHSFYKGLSEAYNQSFALLNVSVGKKIFKNQRGEIAFNVNDLLNENEAITRTITESYIQDSQTNVIERYFMVSFRYDLRLMRF